ncbi:MAG TPA: winged helix DNA-binding domain-containing protein [Thermomicrobiales bacterium]|nr:winged helix DNA-binding domain-containing protein [Thermomicrobiales bacterium]
MGREGRAEVAATWAQVFAWRARRHFLDAPMDEGPSAIAGRLCGVQAQVMSRAEMAIGIRGRDATPVEVRRALGAERSLVKTWAMRGTLHLLPTADLSLFTAFLAARASAFTAAWVRYGVDMPAILAAIPEALDGRCLTREALAREVARIGGRPELGEALLGSWGGTLKPAAYRGLLCFGPNEGRNITFVAPRQWVGDWQEMAIEEASAELVRRYLDAYGPATPEDFAHWSGSRLRPVRKTFARLAGELVTVDVEGERAWLTPAAAADLAAEGGTGAVRLLPGFDPYTIGAIPRLDRHLPASLRARISRTAGWISPVLLVAGRIAGVWQHDVRRGAARVTIEPFAPLPARARAAAERHAATLAPFLGAPVETVWEPPGR